MDSIRSGSTVSGKRLRRRGWRMVRRSRGKHESAGWSDGDHRGGVGATGTRTATARGRPVRMCAQETEDLSHKVGWECEGACEGKTRVRHRPDLCSHTGTSGRMGPADSGPGADWHRHEVHCCYSGRGVQLYSGASRVVQDAV